MQVWVMQYEDTNLSESIQKRAMNNMELHQGRVRWQVRKIHYWWTVDMEQAAQGSGCSPSPARVKEVFGQCSLTQGLNFAWCCVEVGLDDSYRSLQKGCVFIFELDFVHLY